ncbi:microsomal glutathione S-transferase 1-like [Ptychodera flava]|uniref:microsomal glutathione S-transferase 1-like n=1 Tax=Ptychodera flava TaxID=63121 RepID=UPI00396A2A55
METTSPLCSENNQVFRSYAFYASILIVKWLVLSPLTGLLRKIKRAYANPEDTGDAGTQAVKQDPDVERIKRCHQNDVENITPFLILGLLYTTIDPSPVVALYTFRVFTGARFCHTLSYLAGKQPARSMSFLVGMICNLSLFAQILSSTL